MPSIQPGSAHSHSTGNHITDPSGGVTNDAEARTAINAILDLLEAADLMAGA